MRAFSVATFLSVFAVSLTAAGSGVSRVAWRKDVSSVAIPSVRAQGRVAGEAFVAESAELTFCGLNKVTRNGKVLDQAHSYILKLRQGKGFFADKEFSIFFALDLHERIAGKTLSIKPSEFGSEAWRRASGMVGTGATVGRGLSGVHMDYLVAGSSMPKTEMFMDRYSARMEFGIPQNGWVTGKVYVTVPDGYRSFVFGTFRAKIVDVARSDSF